MAKRFRQARLARFLKTGLELRPLCRRYEGKGIGRETVVEQSSTEEVDMSLERLRYSDALVRKVPAS